MEWMMAGKQRLILFDKCQTKNYTVDMQSKTVKTRELLRNFKEIKGQLTSGRVHFVVIDIGDDCELELKVRNPKKTVGNVLRWLETQPKSHGFVARTDLFDTFLRDNG